MLFIMDPKHNIKKIWNNIEKTNQKGELPCLKLQGKTITWNQLAYGVMADGHVF